MQSRLRGDLRRSLRGTGVPHTNPLRGDLCIGYPGVPRRWCYGAGSISDPLSTSRRTLAGRCVSWPPGAPTMTSSNPPEIDLLDVTPETGAPDCITLDLDPTDIVSDATVAAPHSAPPPSPAAMEVFLDPSTIRESAAPNRDASAYADAAFEQLKTNIQSAGRNISAIKVRRVKRVRGRALAHVLYEVVYGHRRLRACQELGLQVLAVIENEMDDRAALLERVAENTGRQDFTALELGRICVHALKAELFATQRQLASALGRDTGDISKAIALASLPPAVIAAFDCPSDLQYRHAKPLRDAYDRDPSAVMAAAQELFEEIGPKPPGKVLACLTREATNAIGPSNSAPTIPLVWQGTTFGEYQIGAGGHVTIKILDQVSSSLGEILARELQEFYGMYISDLSNSRHQRRLGRES